MNTFFKIIIFLVLLSITMFSAWKFGREVEKQSDFGTKYLGITKKELLDKLGKPDLIKSISTNETNDDFHFIFEDFYKNCNSEKTITYIFYDNLWNDFEFWLIQDEIEEKVILVK